MIQRIGGSFISILMRARMWVSGSIVRNSVVFVLKIVRRSSIWRPWNSLASGTTYAVGPESHPSSKQTGALLRCILHGSTIMVLLLLLLLLCCCEEEGREDISSSYFVVIIFIVIFFFFCCYTSKSWVDNRPSFFFFIYLHRKPQNQENC